MKHHLRTDTKILNLWLMIGILGFAGSAGAKVTLTRNGQPAAVLVHNGHLAPAPGLAERHVRQGHIPSPPAELQAYIKQMTGAELPLVQTLTEAGDTPAIIFRVVNKVPGASNRETGRQAYRITTAGKHLTLTAATELGLHYAVYGLLEDHLGCRFYTFRRKGLSYEGPGFEIVPRRPTLVVDDLDVVDEPAFTNRGIIYWLGSYPWILKNRGIGARGDQASGALAAGHNFYDLLPPQDKRTNRGERKGLFAAHPEFYPLTKAGKRETPWSMGLCGTNPELPRFLAAALADHIEVMQQRAKGEIDWSRPFSAAQGDGFVGCQCAPCRELVEKEQSEAAPLILMLNRAITELNKTHPKAQVITFSYFETLDAPKTLKPHKNLWINVVSSARSQNMAGDQVGPIVDNPANRDYARAIREWPRIAPNRVTVWHWDSYRADWPSVFYLVENMRYMHDCGIYGVNPQYCGGPWVDLLAWLYLKLAWNPDQDADQLVRQFLEDNYGKQAAAHVGDYLKLTQTGYENSLHVPSAVRWSGWTPTTRLKMFPPSLLAEMTAAMDKAKAAAEKAGNRRQLANLIAARGQSLDVVNINAATYSGKPWGPVRYDGDGKNWYVTGADPLVPPSLMRAKRGIVMDGGGEHGVLRGIARYSANNGGPLVELDGKAMSAAVCPDLKGQITSAVDKQSDKQLLAVQGAQAGYMDVFGRIHAQIWLPMDQNRDVARRANEDWSAVWSDFRNPRSNSVQTDVVLSPAYYGFYPTQFVRRAVTIADNGLRVERQFIQEKTRHPLANPSRFNTRWRLALPNHKLAKVAVKGGGIEQMLDLRYAVPGGIEGVKAGQRLPGADNMDERFDTVIAVSDAQSTRLPLRASADGDVAIRLDRGDGVAVILTTTVAGWEAVEIKPVVDQGFLEVTLVGAALPMDEDAKTIDLPVQTLAAKPVPLAKDVTKTTIGKTAAPVKAKLGKTGDATAVNEIDGAQLVWIPSGEFLRGSPEGQGGGDERPQKTIQMDGYWIYKHPVTVAQYRKFCQATGKEFKPTWGQSMHAEPTGDEGAYAVLASWYEAEAYARWAGAALPTEAQWEKAARGADGREYPWEGTWNPKRCVSMEETLYRFSPGFRPVGSHPQGASPYGIEDMCGNVWEWVADWYAYEYYGTAPASNPKGPATGSHKVLRGGCSLFDERFSRTAARMVMPPHVRDWTPTGFRCAVTTHDRNAVAFEFLPDTMMPDSPVTFPDRGALPAKYRPDVKTKAYPAEKDYFLFSSPPRSLEQIQNIQTEMPKGEFTQPSADWVYLPRTRKVLTEGGDLHILGLGDSIVNDTFRSGWLSKLAEAYPKANIRGTVYVRGGGGCRHYRYEGRIRKYLVPLKPDLVFIGGISQRKDYDAIEDVIRQIRRDLPQVEILLASGTFGTVDPRRPELAARAQHSGSSDYGAELKKIAAELNCAYLDMTTPWAQYIRSSELHPHRFYRDRVHANESGEQILSKILLSFFE
jgi:formylglycine-generating enzyme required for sulfatase activity/lysophospholipase L1-like esterase